MKLKFLYVSVSMYLLFTGISLIAQTPVSEKPSKTVRVLASDFVPGQYCLAPFDSFTNLRFVIESVPEVPFNQSCIVQSTVQAKQGPDPEIPYFTVRFALPVPPAYTDKDVAQKVGLDSMVFRHNHSPGFEIMPNGDALAIYFSTPAGKSENDTLTSFVQARLRYGSEDWDMPELFFKTRGFNDQSGLLWNDNGKIWFFGGGRNISNFIPFRIATSTDNGASWTFSVPQLDRAATRYTAQPVTSAFRGRNGAICFASDGEDSESFLWQSTDEGIHWKDMNGRTGGRHSVIIPLDNEGKLLSIGGKNADVEGWSPQNISTDWGANWNASTPSPFPPLGTAQRPSLIRLASGNLLFVSDSYMHKKKLAPPAGWKYGDNCFVALSKDNGETWYIKPLPVQLPQYHRAGHPALGYVTARQAPNGLIHVLTTVTLPCLQYEFNEAWIESETGDMLPEKEGGEIRNYSECYPDGRVCSKWSARICPNGRYLLHGTQIDYYNNGEKKHQAKYINGRKTGRETYWAVSGKKIWSWQRDLKKNRGTWTHYWPNGNKKTESTWNLRPEARDLKRFFFGYVAEGLSRNWDEQGNLISVDQFKSGDLSLPEPIVKHE